MSPEIFEALVTSIVGLLAICLVLHGLELGLAWWERRHPESISPDALDRTFARAKEREEEVGRG